MNRSFALFVTSPVDMEPSRSFSRSFFVVNSPAALHTSDMPAKALEMEFCKQFECCSLLFAGLHELLAHYEDEIHSTRHSRLSPKLLSVPFEDLYTRAFRSIDHHLDDCSNFAPMMDICKRAIVNIIDPDMDSESDADSCSSKNGIAASCGYGMDNRILLKRRRLNNRAFPAGSSFCKKRKRNILIKEAADSTDTDVDIITVDDDDIVNKVNGLAIIPLTPPISDEESEDKHMLPSKLQKRPPALPKALVEVKVKKPRQSSLSVLDPETGERKYICAVNECKKQYKNANGLKYHLTHAHPNGEGVPKEYLLFQRKKEEDGYRPYSCTVEGCIKKYKNLNGLKYHIEHYHSALLPAATPPPAAPTPPPTPIISQADCPIDAGYPIDSIYPKVFPPAPAIASNKKSHGF